MGDVISISRVSDLDIFAQFNDQCPQIPEEIDSRIPRSAHKAVHKNGHGEITHSFRNHCIVVAALALIVLLAVHVGTGVLLSQVDNSSSETDTLNTDYRNSWQSWQAYIHMLESDPIYQRIIEEKRLYSIQYPE